MKKYIISVLLIGVMIMATGCEYNDGGLVEESITSDEYHAYDHYGILESVNESEALDLLIKTVNFDDFKKIAVNEKADFFSCDEGDNIEAVTALIEDVHKVSVIAYAITEDDVIASFSIDYLGSEGRVIVEYFNTGLIRKTFKEDGLTVSISNELEKQTLTAEYALTE